jgi:hypothetical protein
MSDSTTSTSTAQDFNTTINHDGVPAWFNRCYAEVELDSSQPCVLLAMDTKDFKFWSNMVNEDYKAVPTNTNKGNTGKRVLANNPLIEKRQLLRGFASEGITTRKGFEWSGTGKGSSARAEGDFLVLMTKECFIGYFGPRCWWNEV